MVVPKMAWLLLHCIIHLVFEANTDVKTQSDTTHEPIVEMTISDTN